jgi:hypothetical protein
MINIKKLICLFAHNFYLKLNKIIGLINKKFIYKIQIIKKYFLKNNCFQG